MQTTTLSFENDWQSLEGIAFDDDTPLLVREGGTATISVDPTLARYLLPEALSIVSKRYPKFGFNVICLGDESSVRGVLQQDIDLAILHGQGHLNEAISVVGTCTWSYRAIVPRQHRLAQLQCIGLDDLCGYPLITMPFDLCAWSANQAVHTERLPRSPVKSCDADLIKELVSHGVGVGIVPSFAADLKSHSTLVDLDISHLFRPGSASLLIKRSAYPGVLVLQLLRTLKETGLLHRPHLSS